MQIAAKAKRNIQRDCVQRSAIYWRVRILKFLAILLLFIFVLFPLFFCVFRLFRRPSDVGSVHHGAGYRPIQSRGKIKWKRPSSNYDEKIIPPLPFFSFFRSIAIPRLNECIFNEADDNDDDDIDVCCCPTRGIQLLLLLKLKTRHVRRG